MKDLSTIMDELYDTVKDATWDVEDLLTALQLSTMDKMELYKSCEDMPQEEFEDWWCSLQSLRTAVIDVLNINN